MHHEGGTDGPMDRKFVRAALACASTFACTVAVVSAHAQSGAEVAGQVVNPFVSMTKVPLQLNVDRRLGPQDGGNASVFNIQPLIPFALNADWDVISRTIVSVVAQRDIAPGSGSQFGLGDTLQSFLLSPPKANAHGIDWGLGAALLLPTATNDLLGSKQWALGPTGGAFMDSGPWTVGILANHVWTVAGSVTGGRISSTFVQPLASYAPSDAWSYTLQTEATYDWTARQWSVPIEASVARLTKIGGYQLTVEPGVHYWAASPQTGPKGWGLSFTTTLLFPK